MKFTEGLNVLVSRFQINVFKSDVKYNPNLKYVPKRVVQSVWYGKKDPA